MIRLSLFLHALMKLVTLEERKGDKKRKVGSENFDMMMEV